MRRQTRRERDRLDFVLAEGDDKDRRERSLRVLHCFQMRENSLTFMKKLFSAAEARNMKKLGGVMKQCACRDGEVNITKLA
jgi:hypothetical protein